MQVCCWLAQLARDHGRSFKEFFFQVGVNFFEVGVGDVKSECVNRSMRSGKACGDHCKSA